MKERLTKTRFVFESGRSLQESPKGQPLSELLVEFSKRVLAELDRSQLVLVAGESGLGKTELFLGTFGKVRAGGIADLLSELGRSYAIVDVHQHCEALNQLELILANHENKPEFVLIDESGAMAHSKEVHFSIVRKLIEDGRKVVLVCGGSANAAELNTFVRDGLTEVGVVVGESQMFEYPPLILNEFQCLEILLARYPNLTPEIAHLLIDELNKQDIPKIFRVLYYSSTRLGQNTKSAMRNFILHIKTVQE